jgi:CBS domain-containing protein
MNDLESKGGAVMKKVRDAMTADAGTASPAESLAEVAQMMKQQDVGSLPVVDEGRLVGILTDRDIVVRAVADRVDVGAITVGDIASPELVTVEPDQDLDEALRLMSRHQVRRLPVVEDGHLVGMLAQADVAIMAKEKNAGEMLEQISEPSLSARG